MTSTVDPALEALCYDPQTSGGLLAAVDAGAVARAESAGFTLIGRVEAGGPGISFTP